LSWLKWKKEAYHNLTRPELSIKENWNSLLLAVSLSDVLHFSLVENGITRDEIIELITHLAFYSGWPAAMSAILLAKDVFRQEE
jgi:4-carboxymuconolactone decarboxylase